MAVDIVASADDLGEDLHGVFGVAKELLSDLFDQLACGGNDETLNLFLLGVDLGEEGEPERGGFAGSSLGLSNKVAPVFLKMRDGFALNFGRLVDAKFLETFDEVF